MLYKEVVRILKRKKAHGKLLYLFWKERNFQQSQFGHYQKFWFLANDLLKDQFEKCWGASFL